MSNDADKRRCPQELSYPVIPALHFVIPAQAAVRRIGILYQRLPNQSPRAYPVTSAAARQSKRGRSGLPPIRRTLVYFKLKHMRESNDQGKIY